MESVVDIGNGVSINACNVVDDGIATGVGAGGGVDDWSKEGGGGLGKYIAYHREHIMTCHTHITHTHT